MKPTRDFYISGRGAELAHAAPEYGIEIYYCQQRGKPCAIFFAGRAQKPNGAYYYSSIECREEVAKKWLDTQIKLREERKQARAEKLAYQHTLKEGDLLRAQWGYEQTNNDFYQIVAVKGKSVVLREIAQSKEYRQWLAGTTKPVKDHFIGEPFINRVTTGNAVRLTSYKYAYPCKESDNSYFSEYA